MEIDLVILFALIAITVGLLKYMFSSKKHTEEDWSKKLKAPFIYGVIAGGVVCYLLSWILSSITIIDSNMNHTTNYYYSKAVLKSQKPDDLIVDIEDETYTFDNLDLCSEYIANLSYETLVLYPVVYGNKTNISDSIVIIPPSSIMKVKNLPDFYFEEPEEIQVKEDVFSSIIKSILDIGSSETRWIIDSQSNIKKRY